ncbi:MAG: hypothetical protein QME81_19815, partial [bacterium]|nr:hypothetical protein [bacterium]
MKRSMVEIILVGILSLVIFTGEDAYGYGCFGKGENRQCEGGPLFGYYRPNLSEFNDELEGMGLDQIEGTFVVGGKCLHSFKENFQAGLSVAGWWIGRDKIVNGTVKETDLIVVLPTLVGAYRVPFEKGAFSFGGGVGYYPVWYTKEITPQGEATTITRMKGGNVGGQIFFEAQRKVNCHIAKGKEMAMVGEVSYILLPRNICVVRENVTIA